MSRILQSVFEIVSENMEDELDQITTSKKLIVQDSASAETKEECYSSIVDDLKARQSSSEQLQDTSGSSNNLVRILRQRYKKRGILVSYDIKGSFLLKQLVCKTVQELKELGFEDDIWFDKDESKPRSSSSFAQRLEASEECNAALIFLSGNYFVNGPSKQEANIFLQRVEGKEINPNGIHFRVFIVKCELVSSATEFDSIPVDVDLTSLECSRFSIAEKSSVIVGTLSERLEACVTFTTKLYRELPEVEDSLEYVGYKRKTVDVWDKCDVQDWLCSLGVHERYKVSFEENEVDGFLLESLGEEDMVEFLYVDSKVTRQKILHNLKNVLDKERGESWDESCRSRKTREDSVYLVADATDAWIAEFIKADLVKIGIFVHMHEGFASSKTSPIQSKSNIRYLAEASTVLFVMTSCVENSHFIFRELLFAAWLDKPIVTAVFKNSWQMVRFALKAIVGRKPAINFGRNECLDGLEVLRYHVMPRRCQPRAILQQQYVRKMLNGVKLLEDLVSKTTGFEVKHRPKVYLSYHWDMENKVRRIKEFLDHHGCESWTDTNRPVVVSLTKPWRQETRGSGSGGLIQEQMSHSNVVVVCITFKYLYSDNFIKDIQLAQLHKKRLIPIMLQWCSRPLDRLHAFSRKLRISCGVMDMSNDKMLKRNLPELVNIIMKVIDD